MSNLAPCRKGLQAHNFEPKGGEKAAIVTTALTDHGPVWAYGPKTIRAVAATATNTRNAIRRTPNKAPNIAHLLLEDSLFYHIEGPLTCPDYIFHAVAAKWPALRDLEKTCRIQPTSVWLEYFRRFSG
jgi:hypothetical protein